jgi:squalene synthase HpnC
MGVGHYENFPVASVLCPPRLRPAVVAIYRFARTADDIADEGDAPASARLADLAAFRDELRAACAGGAAGAWRASSGASAASAAGPRWPQVFEPLAARLAEFALPTVLLHDLLDAFEQDVRNPAYPDRASLLDYCRRSANPIGRLLLHLYGISDTTALRRSDAICSALQLVNFWQDLSVDGPRGRCYVPEADLAAHGLSREQLARAADGPAVRALVRSLVDWAAALMLEGAPLAHQIPGRAGWELRLVVQGGLRVVETIRRMDHATLARRPTLSAWDVPVLAWRALRA